MSPFVVLQIHEIDILYQFMGFGEKQKNHNSASLIPIMILSFYTFRHPRRMKSI